MPTAEYTTAEYTTAEYTTPECITTPPVLVSSNSEEALLRAHIHDLNAKIADLSEQLHHCIDVCFMLSNRNLCMHDALKTARELARGVSFPPVNTLTRLARIAGITRTILDSDDDRRLAEDVQNFVTAYFRAARAENVEEVVEETVE